MSTNSPRLDELRNRLSVHQMNSIIEMRSDDLDWLITKAELLQVELEDKKAQIVKLEAELHGEVK